MICPLCPKDRMPFNITQFDNNPDHLIIVRSKNNEMHVHGPFDDQVLMNKMVRAMRDEMFKNKLTLELFNMTEFMPVEQKPQEKTDVNENQRTEDPSVSQPEGVKSDVPRVQDQSERP